MISSWKLYYNCLTYLQFKYLVTYHIICTPFWLHIRMSRQVGGWLGPYCEGSTRRSRIHHTSYHMTWTFPCGITQGGHWWQTKWGSLSFQVSIAVIVHNVLFWILIPRGPVGGFWRFGGTCWTTRCHEPWRYTGCASLQNVGIRLQDYTVSTWKLEFRSQLVVKMSSGMWRRVVWQRFGRTCCIYLKDRNKSAARENEVEQIVRNGETQKGCEHTNGRHVP
jgi:hypothetical protein